METRTWSTVDDSGDQTFREGSGTPCRTRRGWGSHGGRTTGSSREAAYLGMTTAAAGRRRRARPGTAFHERPPSPPGAGTSGPRRPAHRWCLHARANFTVIHSNLSSRN
jgi:hypothetical protein